MEIASRRRQETAQALVADLVRREDELSPLVTGNVSPTAPVTWLGPASAVVGVG
jgi:hypothetical protein